METEGGKRGDCVQLQLLSAQSIKENRRRRIHGFFRSPSLCQDGTGQDIVTLTVIIMCFKQLAFETIFLFPNFTVLIKY
jgi:hypothetical protein